MQQRIKSIWRKRRANIFKRAGGNWEKIHTLPPSRSQFNDIDIFICAATNLQTTTPIQYNYAHSVNNFTYKIKKLNF